MKKNKKTHDKTANEYMEIGNQFLVEEEYDKVIENFHNALNVKINSFKTLPNLFEILKIVENYYNIGTEFESVGDNWSAKIAYLSAMAILEKVNRAVYKAQVKLKTTEKTNDYN